MPQRTESSACATTGLADIEDIGSAAGDLETRSAAAEVTVHAPSEKSTSARRRRKMQGTFSAAAPTERSASTLVEDDTPRMVPGTQTVFLKTYGCAHNTSDSEYMAGLLLSYGYRITENMDEADLCLLNSCTVKGPSQQSFVNLVTDAKKAGKRVVVSGCVPQGDRTIPELEDTSTIGVQQIERVVEVVEETLKGHTVKFLGKKTLPRLDLPKIRKNPYIEIVPIAVGCLSACTYCKTKHARGQLGSYEVSAIIDRVRQVIREGVVEVWLSSEDTGAYGRDLHKPLPYLIDALIEVLDEINDPNVMLRFGMTNPPYVMDHLDAVVRLLNHRNVYAFLHVPVQAGSDRVLDKMKREYTVADFRHIVEYVRKNVPGVTISTDIICGFPTETDEEFSMTLELTKDLELHNMNISQFYPRPGTPAMRMKRVPTNVVKDRSRAITRLVHAMSPLDPFLGQRVRAWFTEVSDKHNQSLGHTKNYTQCMVPRDDALLGKSALVEITETQRWCIIGKVVEESSAPQKQPSAVPGVAEAAASHEVKAAELAEQRAAQGAVQEKKSSSHLARDVVFAAAVALALLVLWSGPRMFGLEKRVW